MLALLAGQSLVLRHAQVHAMGEPSHGPGLADTPLVAGVQAQAQGQDERAPAFGHEAGAQCSLLDHLLCLADVSAVALLWGRLAHGAVDSLPSSPAHAAPRWADNRARAPPGSPNHG